MNRLVIFACIVVSTSALSCFECTDDVKKECPKDPNLRHCPKKHRVAGGLCGCCTVCAAKPGDLCSESLPCREGSTCYMIDYDEYLPWFYKGTCVTDGAFKQLPSKPTYCGAAVAEPTLTVSDDKLEPESS